MPRIRREHPIPRRRQAARTASPPASPGRLPGQDPARRQAWAGKSPQEVLALYPPGRTPALRVVDVLIELFNTQHTALEKSVSHKTRYERAQFLRRFFRDLQAKGGFKLAPDPRNLGQRHVHAMVQVWRQQRLAAGTIQTYLSFLRGLASWLGKPGFIRQPAHYGLQPHEVQRHGNAQRDRSWSGNGVNVADLLAKVSAYDERIGASMRLMVALGLRRKESVMCRPHAHVHPFADTGLPDDKRRADWYLWVRGKGGRVRWLALASDEQRAAIVHARSVAPGADEHLGQPGRSLKSNLRRLDYVLTKFGLTKAAQGTTGHGARHEHLQGQYRGETGKPAPIRGGGPVERGLDRAARLHVSEVAGHARVRAAGAYLGHSTVMRSKGQLGQDEGDETVQVA